MTVPRRLLLTPLGHSCVLIDIERNAGLNTRILLDPGSLTPTLEPIERLDGVLITHAHHDHIDVGQLTRVRDGRVVPVFGDDQTADLLRETVAVESIHGGYLEIRGVGVDVISASHEQLYPGLPVPFNVGYRIDARVYAPGDSFAVPPWRVEVLLLPTGAPWMKLSESIDFMRAIAPRVVVPVHDGGLVYAHRELHRSLMQRFAPAGTSVLRPEVGEELEL